MKICFLTSFHASWTKQEATILRELGHTVYLFYPTEHASLGFSSGSRLGDLLQNVELFFRCIPACLRSDLIYCWFAFPAGVIAGFWGKVLRKPVLLNVAGSDVACVPIINYGSALRWYLRPFISWALNNATRVIAISRDVAHWAERWGAKDVTIVYEGVDVKKFRSLGLARVERKNEHILLAVSWLEKNNVRRKDFESLLKALPEVARSFPDVKLVIAGKKGSGYPFLRQMVNDLKIENNVVFRGFVPDQELLELYDRCDVFVHPSLYESFPTICVEAQACEKPVVTTKISSMPEVVEDYKTGLLVDPRDPKALAEAIIGLLSNPVFSRRLGKSGRQRVIRFFSKEVRKERVREVLATLTGMEDSRCVRSK